MRRLKGQIFTHSRTQAPLSSVQFSHKPQPSAIDCCEGGASGRGSIYVFTFSTVPSGRRMSVAKEIILAPALWKHSLTEFVSCTGFHTGNLGVHQKDFPLSEILFSDIDSNTDSETDCLRNPVPEPSLESATGKPTKSCTQTVDSCKCVMLLVCYPEFCSVQKSTMPRITQELIEVDKKIKLDRNRATCLICGKTFVSSSFLKSARRHVRKHGLLQSRYPTNRSRSVSPEPVIRQSSPQGTCN